MMFEKLKEKAITLYKIKQLREALPQLPMEDIIALVKEEMLAEKQNGRN